MDFHECEALVSYSLILMNQSLIKHSRGEDPVGDWTIRVGDQATATQIGHFLGWRIKFWGSTVDASQAKSYELSLFDTLLPQPPKSHDSSSATGSSTKAHPKPTDFLPSDHGHAPGQSDGPAFPTNQEDVLQPSASATPTPDEGWFSDMGNLTNNKKWFFAAAGAVLLFGLGAAIFFWRRRRAMRRAQYLALGGEEGGMAMSGLRGGGAQSKTLYEAFAYQPDEDDDDEDADEETRLAGGRPQDRSPGGLGFHEGFLEDDEPDTARSQRYRDEPDETHAGPSSRSESESDSPAESSTEESGDGSSWEHASGSQVRES
jgi:kexin